MRSIYPQVGIKPSHKADRNRTGQVKSKWKMEEDKLNPRRGFSVRPFSKDRPKVGLLKTDAHAWIPYREFMLPPTPS